MYWAKSALNQVCFWVTANSTASFRGWMCSLCQSMTLHTHTHKLFVCFTFSFSCFSLMFSTSLSTQVFIITYSTLPDCFKMTPTGTVYLTMAVLHILPKTRIAFSPQIRPNMVVILWFLFIENGKKIQGWREIEGNIQRILAPVLCTRWRRARCVMLWWGSFMAQAESTAVYSSRSRSKMQSWPYSTPLKSRKATRAHESHGSESMCVSIYKLRHTRTHRHHKQNLWLHPFRRWL